ncbi:diacylglycerol O-acyltransferase [Saccharomonospora sp. CUA-673]|uniref:WS/DGAT/MGAT family O-acyltransferase n=1 Tax=Saccharomonospora sp. CUA-673 TaxID=1904969 RepID=UPI000964355B|nr:wax ester/triacylglycerol synthase family O-acyltransferase [Saccharomonospora sp. CUA-673]OLT45252.1 diacylglycerol O-acyltransferase [Saccharomonospora sp. CUA-673]
MSLMPVTDSMFLAVETREHPMHVGGLQLFTPPDDAGPEYLRDLRENLLERTSVREALQRRLRTPVNTAGYLAWQRDPQLDLDYHFRHSALPRPGRIRELLELTSRWHSTLLDRHRPLWEAHLVEGLADGRFAVYSKIHHAAMDGVSALRQLTDVLSDDPADRDCPPPWGKPRSSPPAARPALGALDPREAVRAATGAARQLAEVPGGAVRIAKEMLRAQALTLPLQAPRTMFNVPIGGARRFAAQSWPLDRVRAVASGAGVSRNDVVLAMCAGALREYLVEAHALPAQPLTALVPVSMRSAKDADAGEASGNRIGALLANLGTDLADPADRLATIARSTTEGKRLFRELTPVQALLLSALNVAPLAASPLPGFTTATRPPFNLVISNVPGPRRQMYWNGARLDGIYPASVLLDGQALNITLTTTGDNVDVGITGCRRSVPHLQRLLTHLETALTDLEKTTR